MTLNSLMGMGHSNCEIQTVFRLFALKQPQNSNTFQYCYKVVFLNQSVLVIIVKL